jgi:PBP1b-binding outer membrane lipoprotein LpoB
MIKSILTIALTGTCAVFFMTGCSAPKTQYVDSDSSRLIANVDEINIQDFARAADEMVQSIIEECISTGALKGTNADTRWKIEKTSNTLFVDKCVSAFSSFHERGL